MSGPSGQDEPRRSRWLPVVVASLFALVLLADLAVVLVYGNYRELFEEDRVEITFSPISGAAAGGTPEAVAAEPGGKLVAGDGTVMVEVSEDGIEVRAPGRVVLRFRAPDAGRHVELRYSFGQRSPGARCELVLARVPSRHGVDVISRRVLDGGKRSQGRFRHYLADHAGWFELSLEVNPSAADAGFAVTIPRVVVD